MLPAAGGILNEDPESRIRAELFVAHTSEEEDVGGAALFFITTARLRLHKTCK